MKTLFNPSDMESIIQRILSLNSSSQALWGKMNVAQMLTHCQRPLMAGLGELSTTRTWIGKLMGGFFKKKLLRSLSWDKGMPTDKNFVVNGCGSFEEEKQKLIALINRFQNSQDSITKDPHPFFGKMSVEEWGILQYKHLNHHLSQFGA